MTAAFVPLGKPPCTNHTDPGYKLVMQSGNHSNRNGKLRTPLSYHSTKAVIYKEKIDSPRLRQVRFQVYSAYVVGQVDRRHLSMRPKCRCEHENPGSIRSKAFNSAQGKGGRVDCRGNLTKGI